jgi:hypothetical protein
MSNASRDANGKFLPGHHLPGPGRPTRQHEIETLDAIKASFPPERIVAMLERAYEIAESQGSARAIVAVVENVLDRTVGRPVARSISASTKFETMLAALGSNEKIVDADDTSAIDAQQR